MAPRTLVWVTTLALGLLTLTASVLKQYSISSSVETLQKHRSYNTSSWVVDENRSFHNGSALEISQELTVTSPVVERKTTNATTSTSEKQPVDNGSKNRATSRKEPAPAPTVHVTTMEDLMQDTGLKVPNPIFVLSLPKSGTTSTWKYFLCGKQAAAHHYTKNETRSVFKIGTCMGGNVWADRPMLEGCGGYRVLADAGAIWARGQRCFYPSVHGLDNIAKHYPTSTVLLVRRNTTAWVRSARHWNGLLDRMGSACDGFPGNQTYQATDDEWMDWYEAHNNKIRQFVTDHPTLTYVEASLEDPNTAEYLEERTGVSASCWANCPPDRPKCKPADKAAAR